MASLISCTGVLLDVWPWCFDQRAWCMDAAVSSNLPGVSTNARADDTIPRPFGIARVATMTVAKVFSRWVDFRSSLDSRLLGQLGTKFDPKLLRVLGNCMDLLGAMLGVARTEIEFGSILNPNLPAFVRASLLIGGWYELRPVLAPMPTPFWRVPMS